MAAVGELVLVLGLLVSAHCEVRARDPEVEEEEQGGRTARGGLPPQHGATEPPLLQEGGKHPIRPGYQTHKQKQWTTHSLRWTCCPGHRAHQDTGELQQRGDPHREQNDYQGSSFMEGNQNLSPDHADSTTGSQAGYVAATSDLLAPQVMVLVLSQLQPVLQVFNRSLEQLGQQVGDLARDVAQLKGAGLEGAELKGAEVQVEQPDVAVDVGLEAGLEARLEDVFQQVMDIRRQLEKQRMDLDQKLHSQHAMLHFNLTSFKTDTDLKLKRHQKMLQVSLQALNASLTELMLEQDQLNQDQLNPEPLRPADTSALWNAIERLDNMVVNNTVKVDRLMEDVDMTSGDVQELRRDLKELDKRINQTARNSQIQFMETGLEVEAAKVAVLGQVDELAGNLSQQGQRLQEMDVDVDYLYTVVYKNFSTDCDCVALRAAVTRLEQGVANVTELANENRLALDESDNREAGQWAGDWEPAVEALQRGIQEMKEALASEQTRTRTLDLSVTRLGGLVSGLQQTDVKQELEMNRLTGSFNSLLKDAIRHSDVLETLLGEEVLEFLDWPVQDQEAHSIPALQQQLREQEQRVSSLLGEEPGGREEVSSADQPSSQLLPDDWLPGSMRSFQVTPTRERQLVLQPGRRSPRGDGSDLWRLEQAVEELGLKVQRLQVKQEKEEAKLQQELRWLKRGLEEHLRMFKNVFSYQDVLAASNATLPKDGRKEKRRGTGGGSGRGGGAGGEGAKVSGRNQRNKSSVSAPFSLSDFSLLFAAVSPRHISDNDVAFEAFLNRGGFDSDSGTFTAPQDGIYLFILTLNLRPGPAHISLRRGRGGAQVSLRQLLVTEAGPVTAVGVLPLREGEELRPHLRGGAWAESENNIFVGLLLLHWPPGGAVGQSAGSL